MNKESNIVYQHVGEGDYPITETNIRLLLGLPTSPPEAAAEVAPVIDITPETYLGYARAQRYASVEEMQRNISADYTLPQQLALDAWALQGAWNVSADKVTTTASNSSLSLHFKASKVYAVMGAPGKSVRVQVTLQPEDGKTQVKQIEVSGSRLYQLVDGTKIITGMLTLQPDTSGLEVYTFTFGSD